MKERIEETAQDMARFATKCAEEGEQIAPGVLDDYAADLLRHLHDNRPDSGERETHYCPYCGKEHESPTGIEVDLSRLTDRPSSTEDVELDPLSKAGHIGGRPSLRPDPSTSSEGPTCSECGEPMQGGSQEGPYRRWYCDEHMPVVIHYTSSGTEGETVDDFPRRRRTDQWVPAERAIGDAKEAVESLPADDRLTDAVVLLEEAQEKVADYVDGVEKPGAAPTETDRRETIEREIRAYRKEYPDGGAGALAKWILDALDRLEGEPVDGWERQVRYRREFECACGYLGWEYRKEGMVNTLVCLKCGNGRRTHQTPEEGEGDGTNAFGTPPLGDLDVSGETSLVDDARDQGGGG